MYTRECIAFSEKTRLRGRLHSRCSHQKIMNKWDGKSREKQNRKERYRGSSHLYTIFFFLFRYEGRYIFLQQQTSRFGLRATAEMSDAVRNNIFPSRQAFRHRNREPVFADCISAASENFSLGTAYGQRWNIFLRIRSSRFVNTSAVMHDSCSSR